MHPRPPEGRKDPVEGRKAPGTARRRRNDGAARPLRRSGPHLAMQAGDQPWEAFVDGPSLPVPGSRLPQLASTLNAPWGDHLTVQSVPRRQPPRTTRSGTLKARPGALGHQAGTTLPLGSFDTPGEMGRALSPLSGLELPEPANLVEAPPEPVILVRRLDGGRLFARDLVTAAGWAMEIPLAADLSQSQRVRLTAAPGIHRPVMRTKSPHVDRDGRIIIPSGLRSYLSLDNRAFLVAWTNGDGVVHLAPARVLPEVFAAFDRDVHALSEANRSTSSIRSSNDDPEDATIHNVAAARAKRA